MGTSQSNTSLPIGNTSTWVDFENDWFAQGVSRLAYRGTYHGDSRREGKKCVVKVYKEEWYERLGEHAWKADDRASRKAREMAELFNNKHRTTKPIEFLVPEITRVDTRAAFNFLGFIPIWKQVKGKVGVTSVPSADMIPASATIAVEKYLEGNYVKFLSNNSYVNEDVHAFTPSAFGHFTFHRSQGTLLVSDLQGIRCKSGYTFTDPAIHSVGQKLGYYGPTDLGAFGIAKFFLTHACNDLCKGLLKPKVSTVSPADGELFNHVVQSIQSKNASSYTRQLGTNSAISSQKIADLHNQVTLDLK